MADIQTYLDYILSKVYGKDVRQAIVDAINQCYVDASEGITPVITTTEQETGTLVTITVGANSSSFLIENGTATDEQVEDWLDNHPEATTSVADGSISTAKLADGAVTSAKLDPNIDLGVADNSVSTSKLVDHAVTMDKTDFYYEELLTAVYPWLSTSGGNGSIAKATITDANLATANSEMPNTLSIVCVVNNDYWNSGNTCRFGSRSSSYQYTYRGVEHEVQTITYDGTKYGIISFNKTDFQTAYASYLNDIAGGNIGVSFEVAMGNGPSRFTGLPMVIAGEVTTELIESGFSQTIISEDFVTAVQRAIEEGGGTSTDEETAKNRLTGKVMINLGDSYTKGMESLFSALATKYGMVADNRGVVSSSICGDTSGNKGFNPMWNRANTIVSDYASGYTINGTSYTASQVAVITFMGGANDGYGIETWLGTGIHETDKETIYGACNHIFNVLAKNFPNAKLICITQPSHYHNEVSSITTDAVAQTLGFEDLAELQQMDDIQFSNYSMALKEQAVYNTAYAYGWNIIDMFHEMPTIFNPSNRSAYWNSDKLHLTTAGYTLISNALDKKIVELVVG